MVIGQTRAKPLGKDAGPNEIKRILRPNIGKVILVQNAAARIVNSCYLSPARYSSNFELGKLEGEIKQFEDSIGITVGSEMIAFRCLLNRDKIARIVSPELQVLYEDKDAVNLWETEYLKEVAEHYREGGRGGEFFVMLYEKIASAYGIELPRKT
ncbi:MAG: hypothetical protein AABX71_02510 [Nanoarchaeota archaeon]